MSALDIALIVLSAALAVALITPVGEGPVVPFDAAAEPLSLGGVKGAERERVDDAVTVQQGQAAEHGVGVERVDDDEMAWRLHGRPLAAKREQVWRHHERIRAFVPVLFLLSEEVDNRQVFARRFQQGLVGTECMRSGLP